MSYISPAIYMQRRGAPSLSLPPVVGYWKCDESSGTVLHDSSGNGRHGVISVGTGVVQGAAPLWTGSSGSLQTTQFINRAAYVDISGTIQGNTAWALEAIGVNAKTDSDLWTCLVTLAPGNSAEPGDPGIYGGSRNQGNLRTWSARVYSGNDLASSINSTVPTHLILERNGNVANLYVNGSLVASTTPTGWNAISNTLYMLGCGAFAGSYGIAGRVSDVTLYSGALGAANAAARAAQFPLALA